MALCRLHLHQIPNNVFVWAEVHSNLQNNFHFKKKIDSQKYQYIFIRWVKLPIEFIILPIWRKYCWNWIKFKVSFIIDDEKITFFKVQITYNKIPNTVVEFLMWVNWCNPFLTNFRIRGDSEKQFEIILHWNKPKTKNTNIICENSIFKKLTCGMYDRSWLCPFDFRKNLFCKTSAFLLNYFKVKISNLVRLTGTIYSCWMTKSFMSIECTHQRTHTHICSTMVALAIERKSWTRDRRI